MIIFGLRSRVTNLAMLNLACRNGHTAAHRLVKVTRWFTLFFIPLIPFSRTYRTVCAQCGTQVKWTKADAEMAMQHAVANPAESASGNPVAPPVPSALAADAPPFASGPPAAWYPDPSGGTGQRYWDGSAWTDSVRQD